MSADEPVAGVAEELAKLLAVARTWAQEHPTPCGICPVCQLIAAWPSDRPDLGEKMVQALDIVTTAAHSLAQVFSGPAADRPADRPDDPPSGAGTPPPRVQHIDIG
jgi:hypothetical protein